MVRSPLENCERFCSKKRGNFYFIFRSVDTLTAHIVLFSRNKKIKPTCSSFIFFSHFRTVRNSAKAEVDRELSGVVHGQPQSQPCSERRCLQQRSRDFRVSASTDLCHLSPDPNHPKWEINCNTWPFFFFFSSVSFCISSVLKDTCDCLLGSLATAGWASWCRE